jgi:hypothetical protein
LSQVLVEHPTEAGLLEMGEQQFDYRVCCGKRPPIPNWALRHSVHGRDGVAERCVRDGRIELQIGRGRRLGVWGERAHQSGTSQPLAV